MSLRSHAAASLGDIVTVARVLLASPPAQRSAACSEIFNQASVAHALMHASGKAHKTYGDGSLTSAALRAKPCREPLHITPDYAHCLAVVLQHLRGITS